MKHLYLLISCIVLSLFLHAQPAITSFSPLTGAAGTAVTITGTGFNTTEANNIVWFGAVRGTVTASATSFTVTAPAGVIYAPIAVYSPPSRWHAII